jgi:hypothetical protein
MLRYLRRAGGALAAVSLATAGAYFVAVMTDGHPTPWWPFALLFGLAAAGVLGYLVGQSDPEPRVMAEGAATTSLEADGAAEQENYFITEPALLPRTIEAPQPAPGPVITDRWRQTSDGGQVPGLMTLTHTGMSHPGYGGRQAQDTPPSVKIGMLVACQPIDPAARGTEMRAKFVAFLETEAVKTLIGALTDVSPGMSWKSLAGNGPRTLEAVLTAGEDVLEGVPVASALLLPPVAGESLYGRNGQAATLLLYSEPRTADGGIPPASGLAAWYERFDLALAMPGAFAEFLAKDLRLGTSDNPGAQLGIWLQSYYPLSIMVDTGGLRSLPGSSPSNWFMGWAFATSDGMSGVATARDLLSALCEYTLHLDAFEEILDRIDTANWTGGRPT